MVSQPSLFPAVRAADPDTSHAAAAHLRPTASAVLSAILQVHTRSSGLTDDELVARLPGLYGPTVRTARSRLARAGRLCDSGLRRLSSRGRAQIVWMAVDPAAVPIVPDRRWL